MRYLLSSSVLGLTLISSACAGAVDPAAETSAEGAEAKSALGEFDPGSTGASDFGDLDLGSDLNLSGPEPSEPASSGDPMLLARCLDLAGASLPAKEAFCRSLPDAGARARCWKNRFNRISWTGWCYFEFAD
jgi:hypothetical protein